MQKKTPAQRTYVLVKKIKGKKGLLFGCYNINEIQGNIIK
jgi:hypothetical protein